MPFRIENKTHKLGANFVATSTFQLHAVREDRFITGQQQHSGVDVAKLVIEALEK